MSTATKQRRSTSRGRVTANGIYGDLEAAYGHVELSLGDIDDATVQVELSQDDGESWSPHLTITPDVFHAGRFRGANLHDAEYVTRFWINEPTRLRLRVKGFSKPFRFWMD